MSTLVLTAIVLVAAVLATRLRRVATSTNSRVALRASLVLCLATPIGVLVGLRTGLVASTPTNFALSVIVVIYFGVIQSYRIHRDTHGRRHG